MSDFLQRVLSKNIGQASVLHPPRPTRFEPHVDVMGPVEDVSAIDPLQPLEAALPARPLPVTPVAQQEQNPLPTQTSPHQEQSDAHTTNSQVPNESSQPERLATVRKSQQQSATPEERNEPRELDRLPIQPRQQHEQTDVHDTNQQVAHDRLRRESGNLPKTDTPVTKWEEDYLSFRQPGSSLNRSQSIRPMVRNENQQQEERPVESRATIQPKHDTNDTNTVRDAQSDNASVSITLRPSTRPTNDPSETKPIALPTIRSVEQGNEQSLLRHQALPSPRKDTVNITIGRIEIKASTAPKPKRSRPTAPPRPEAPRIKPMGLDDYFRQKSES